MYKQVSLKPQDIVVLARIILFENRGENWRYKDIGNLTGISEAEVCRSIFRLEICNLFNKKNRRANVEGFIEFIEHGIQYSFPALLGNISFGVKAAYDISTGETVKDIKCEELVWATEQKSGKRGEKLIPLFHTLSQISRHDDEFIRILVLIDNLRYLKKNKEKHLNELRKILIPPNRRIIQKKRHNIRNVFQF